MDDVPVVWSPTPEPPLPKAAPPQVVSPFDVQEESLVAAVADVDVLLLWCRAAIYRIGAKMDNVSHEAQSEVSLEAHTVRVVLPPCAICFHEGGREGHG